LYAISTEIKAHNPEEDDDLTTIISIISFEGGRGTRAGEAERTGLNSEYDVMALIKESQNEDKTI